MRRGMALGAAADGCGFGSRVAATRPATSAASSTTATPATAIPRNGRRGAGVSRVPSRASASRGRVHGVDLGAERVPQLLLVHSVPPSSRPNAAMPRDECDFTDPFEMPNVDAISASDRSA